MKPAAPAVWADPAVIAGLDLADLDRLREAGAVEVFVPAARLDWEAAAFPPLTAAPVSPRPVDCRRPWWSRAPGRPAPRRTPGRRRATGWPSELRAVALAAERAGLIPVGFHFAPRLARRPGERLPPTPPSSPRSAASSTRGSTCRPTSIAAVVGDPEARDLADAVDFLVVLLFGQRPGEDGRRRGLGSRRGGGPRPRPGRARRALLGAGDDPGKPDDPRRLRARRWPGHGRLSRPAGRRPRPLPQPVAGVRRRQPPDHRLRSRPTDPSWATASSSAASGFAPFAPIPTTSSSCPAASPAWS